MGELHVCAVAKEGYGEDEVVTNLCMNSDEPFKSQDWRKSLHATLDEWLDAADANGYFIVGRPYEEFARDLANEVEAMQFEDDWTPKAVLSFVAKVIMSRGERK